jgi:hypothetical protein
VNGIWSWLNTPHWDLVAILGIVLLGAIFGAIKETNTKLDSIAELLRRRPQEGA